MHKEARKLILNWRWLCNLFWESNWIWKFEKLDFGVVIKGSIHYETRRLSVPSQRVFGFFSKQLVTLDTSGHGLVCGGRFAGSHGSFCKDSGNWVVPTFWIPRRKGIFFQWSRVENSQTSIFHGIQANASTNCWHWIRLLPQKIKRPRGSLSHRVDIRTEYRWKAPDVLIPAEEEERPWWRLPIRLWSRVFRGFPLAISHNKKACLDKCFVNHQQTQTKFVICGVLCVSVPSWFCFWNRYTMINDCILYV